MNIAGALKAKVGPLPGWAWAAMAAGGIGLVMLTRKKSTATKPAGTTAAAASPATSADYSMGYQQGLAAGQPSGSTSGTPAIVPAPVWQFGPTPTGAYIWRVTPVGAQHAPNLPAGPQPPPLTQNELDITGPYGTQWALVPSGYTPQSYLQALAGQGQGSLPSVGVGGGKPRGSMGSRSRSPQQYAHPDIKRQPRYTHFVRGQGGSRDGQIAAAASQAGVHPSRLQMLNGHHRGPLRIA